MAIGRVRKFGWLTPVQVALPVDIDLDQAWLWRDVCITRTRYEATYLETKVADRSTICLQDYAAWLANRETSIAMCRAGDVMLFWGGMGD